MINPLFDGNRTNLIIQAALDGYTARHQTIVNNIANVDTPGYHRLEVSFESELKKASKRLRSDIEGQEVEAKEDDFAENFRISPTVSIDKSIPLRADGSNVSIDREMAELARNSGRINALTEILIRNYTNLKTAIKGS